MALLRNLPAFIALTCFANPAQALPDLKTLSDEQLIALYDKARSAEDLKFCEEMVPILAELLKRPSIEGELVQQKTIADFNCALDEDKWVTAYRLMPDVESALGEDLGTLGFYAALYSDHFLNAADRLSVMIAAKDSQPIIEISDSDLFLLLRQLWKSKQFDRRDQIVTQLMQSQHFKKLPSDPKRGLIDAVISEEGRTGNFKRTPKLIGDVDSPWTFPGYLAMKKYQPVWSQIEKAAGPNLSKPTEKDLKYELARYQADPGSREAFQGVAHSMLAAGKFEDVIAHVASFDHSPSGLAKATEDDIWALNVEAYALDALGRKAEAEAVFDAIAAIPYDPKKNGWLVNFTINRSSRLIKLGQWEKGLEAAKLAGLIAEKSGSPYAKGLIRRDTICALHNLGRGLETTQLIEEAFERRKDGYVVSTIAFLCAGNADRAAQIVVEALEDPVYSEAMAIELQKPEFEILYTRSEIPTLREALLSRPDVRAAYDKVARDIPDAFIPLAGKRRAELAAGKP